MAQTNLPDEIEARIAADVFRSQRGALSSLLQHSLGDISNELYAQSIITKSSMKRAMNETQIASDRTVVLLSAVEDKIEEDSQSFTKFVRVLESEPCWKSLATKLVKTYHKATSDTALLPQPAISQPPEVTQLSSQLAQPLIPVTPGIPQLPGIPHTASNQIPSRPLSVATETPSGQPNFHPFAVAPQSANNLVTKIAPVTSDQQSTSNQILTPSVSENWGQVEEPPTEEITPTAESPVDVNYEISPVAYAEKQPASCMPLSELLKKCSCIPNTCPARYKLNLSYSDESDKLARCFVNYGNRESLEVTKDKKVLIVVRARAVGKTTLINWLVNYVYGIQWEHDFRLQVIEQGQCDGYASTSKITAYTFPWIDGMKIDYSLTVIDTPGLGGVTRDKEILSDMKNLFGIDILDRIHGVLFVQAPVPQSSELQQTAGMEKGLGTRLQYISETVLGIFGKDLKRENIFLMATFSDREKPIIPEHLPDFPYGHYFKFNSSALYGEKVVSGSGSDESDEKEEPFLTRCNWKMGAKSFKKFFRKLEKVDAYSLDQTREVIDTREKLQNSVQKLSEKIMRGLKLIGRLREQKIKSHAIESEIMASSNYVFKVKVKRNRKVDISGQGRLVTNCFDCNMTCHFDCVTLLLKTSTSALLWCLKMVTLGRSTVACAHDNVDGVVTSAILTCLRNMRKKWKLYLRNLKLGTEKH